MSGVFGVLVSGIWCIIQRIANLPHPAIKFGLAILAQSEQLVTRWHYMRYNPANIAVIMYMKRPTTKVNLPRVVKSCIDASVSKLQELPYVCNTCTCTLSKNQARKTNISHHHILILHTRHKRMKKTAIELYTVLTWISSFL